VSLYGHRGASAELPENTLPAFRRSVELGITGVELDVHLSADGVPVVIHDDTVDRTTNGSGAVADHTVAELRALDAGNGEYVPTLAEVLSLFGPSHHINIEIKSNAAGQAVIDVLDELPHLNWAISSFNWAVLRYVKERRPNADLWPLTYGRRSDIDILIDRLALMTDTLPYATRWAESLRTTTNTLDDALDLADQLGSTSLSVLQYGLNEATIRSIHERGYRVWCWTVNEPERARELSDWGVDAMCTDDPATLQALRLNDMRVGSVVIHSPASTQELLVASGSAMAIGD
jgi:glycerophosphoryl diester phosphodiesterase